MPMEFSGFGAFTGVMERLATMEEAVGASGFIEEEAAKAAARAQEMLGHYQVGWPPLAEATVEERVRLGFTPDDPLLRTEDLKNSITYEVSPDGREAMIGVPADAPAAAYAATHEFGDASGAAKVPPRPYLRPAILAVRGEIGTDLRALVASLVLSAGGTRAAAPILGVSQRSVQRYVKGTQNVPRARLQRILRPRT
jgi:phage gpG-like protein